MTQYQQPPHPIKPKHRARNTLLILLSLAVLAAYPAFIGARWAWRSQEKHEVVYKLTGTGPIELDYSEQGDGMHTELKGIQAPWQSATLILKGHRPLLQIFAHVVVGERGEVRCEIWMDGQVVARSDPADSYIAHCLHVPS
jgi:hypothetical protein